MHTADHAIPAACRRIQALAERDPRRAVVVARRAYATRPQDHSVAEAWAGYTLGWALLCWERVEEAQAYVRAALQIFEAHAHTFAVLRCRHALLLINVWLVDHPGLHDDFAGLAEQCIAAGDIRAAARVRIDQARQLNVLGRPYDADTALDAAELPAAEAAIDRARWLRTRGGAAYLRSDFPQAAVLLTQAEQIFIERDARAELARCWMEQGRLAFLQDDLDTALLHYRRAEQLYLRLKLPIRLAFCNKTIGLVLMRRGLYDQALEATLAALRRFGALGRDGDLGGCQLNLGNIYYYTGRWEAALGCYTLAETLCGARGMIGDRLLAQRNRAMVYRIQGRHDEARQLLTTIEADVRALNNQAELAAIWSAQADLLADTGQIPIAVQRYRESRDLFDQLGNAAAASACVVELGWLALREAALLEAQAYFEFAAPALGRHPQHRWRAVYGLARCAEARGEDALALAHYRAASASVSQLRRRIASEEASSGLYAQAAQLHADALALAGRLGAVEVLLEITEGQRALVLQHLLAIHAPPLPAEEQAEHQRLQHAISELTSEQAASHDTSAAALEDVLAAYGDLLIRARHNAPVASVDSRTADLDQMFDLSRIRQTLCAEFGDDWTTVVYCISGDTLLIVIVTAARLKLIPTPYDATLHRLIERASLQQYHDYTYRDFPYHTGQTPHPWAGLRALATKLLPGILIERLHPAHRLLIVPAGPLHTLPWAALRLDQAWLVERTVLQIIPSLMIVLALAKRKPATSAALLIGCSAFGARAAALPGVAAELATVRTVWGAIYDTLADARASHAAILGHLTPDAAAIGILHLASHAQLLPAHGRAAHIKLWDGDLLLADIAGCHVQGGVVVLSACDGAAADVLAGEEVLSLSWAFLAAGAGSVLASLWPVFDQATIRLMAAFYTSLRGHADPALALAQAQRELIAAHDHDTDPTLEPHCWASFVLTGSGRTVVTTGGAAPSPANH